MRYVEGFVAAVPAAHREKYRLHAEKAAATDHEKVHLVTVGNAKVPSHRLRPGRSMVDRESVPSAHARPEVVGMVPGSKPVRLDHRGRGSEPARDRRRVVGIASERHR